MSEHIPAEAFPPGEFLKDELEARGWTQAEFAGIIGRPVRMVNQIIAGKQSITPTTAKEIGAALGTSAMFWLNLESMYRLHGVPEVVSPEIPRKARLRGRFPVREMEKRGWLSETSDPTVLEDELRRFFKLTSIDDQPSLAHAAKKTGYPDELSGAQLAWLFRVSQIAEAMPAPAYTEGKLWNALELLEALRRSPEEIRHVPTILAESGVRFVIVEHVPSSKIDGVCFWLPRPEPSPVIGMSLRLDRIDNFWFVLRHEIEHVLREHGREEAIIDADSDGAETSDKPYAHDPGEEAVANTAAANFCVPAVEMDDFILRYKPLFSEPKLLNFAARMQVHPGLVAGQLRRRTGNYRLFTHHLAKVRAFIAPVSMTDGFGQVIPLKP